MQVPWIANGHQDVARSDPHGSATQFLVAVDPKLIELFRLSVALLRHVPFGNGKNAKENGAEDHARDGRFGLGKQVDYGSGEQNHENYRQAKWDFPFANVQISRNLPFP